MNITPLHIANIALSKLGCDDITDLRGTSREALAINKYYNLALYDILSEHPWSFALKRVALALAAPIPAIIPLWDLNILYTAGDYVYSNYVYPGNNIPTWKIYRCLITHTSGPSTDLISPDYWLEVPMITTVTYWAGTTAYAVGDCVYIHPDSNPVGYQIYRCILAHTSGTTILPDTDTTHWILISPGSIAAMPSCPAGENYQYLYDIAFPDVVKFYIPRRGKHKREGYGLFSTEPNLTILYTYNCQPLVYTAKFIKAFATLLASMMCFEITNDMKKTEDLTALAARELLSAASDDMDSSTKQKVRQDEFEMERIAGGNMFFIPPNAADDLDAWIPLV